MDKIEYSKAQPKQSDDSSQAPHSQQAQTQEPTPEPEDNVQEDHTQKEEQEDIPENSQRTIQSEASYQAPPIAAETENLWDQ